jgi:hypothetical protein
MSFEEYVDSEHDPNQYDMIHAIHSLYYVDCIESTLKHCYYNELKDKGVIACFLDNESNLPSIITLFLNKNQFKDKKACICPAENVVRFAEKEKLKYEKFLIPFSVDVTSIFDESSEEGQYLLEFFTLEVGFRKTADQEVVKEVLKLLKDMSTKYDDGRLVVDVANELILIYKY